MPLALATLQENFSLVVFVLEGEDMLKVLRR